MTDSVLPPQTVITGPLGSIPSSKSVSVTLASDTGSLPVSITTIGESSLRLGLQNVESSLPVALAADHRLIGVVVTDGLDTVLNAARPGYVQFASPPSVNIASSTTLPVSGAVAATIAGIVSTRPADTTASDDTLVIQRLLMEHRTQFYAMQAIMGLQAGAFIPAPEIPGFLSG